ncbi:MAG TPA: tol-pal system protein YbgF [Thermodesulfobacteriota bacterium]|nr:tol-pal system protein YbgF [Thermodesulfobacteriota bacterium]
MQTVNTTEIEAERTTQLEERIKQMEQAYADLNERLFQLERKELGSTLPSTSQPEAPTVGEETFSSPSLYTQGYTNLSQGNYKEARGQFKSFISENPNSPEAVDALYWIAESYYREGKFEEAILELQRFIDTYPQDAKVPLAFLKQGLSLINIGRKEEAKLFLQTLIDKFPESEEAKIAREKLKELESKG